MTAQALVPAFGERRADDHRQVQDQITVDRLALVGHTPVTDRKLPAPHVGTGPPGIFIALGVDRRPIEWPRRWVEKVVDVLGWPVLVVTPGTSHGQPVVQVAGLVPGFSEGLQHIRMGGKARLYIPSYLGYGKKGSGETIPPDSTLVFEIEVLDVIE